MLIYHPAYDAYHSVFRALLVVNSLQSVDLAKLRILDFLLAFPAETRTIRLPREHMALRRRAQQLVNEYHGPVNTKRTFQEMEQIHVTAVRALAASSLISKEALNDGIAERTNTPIPEIFLGMLESAKIRNSGISGLIISSLGSIPIQGIDGLKDRTGLLEHRYDLA